MIRFVSGVDWSGDPGDPKKAVRENQLLVMCACHVQKGELEQASARLAHLKAKLDLASDHVFKHVRSKPATRQAFYRAVGETSLAFSVLVIDKSKWSTEYLAATTGRVRMLDALCDLLVECPEEFIAGQVLVVDAHRSETRFNNDLAVTMRATLRTRGVVSFKKISAVPDHRHDALLIQAADMMAGEVRKLNGAVPSGCSARVRLQSFSG